MEIEHSLDNCISCGKFVHDAFCVYQWKGKEGFCCKPCGAKIHDEGYKLLDAAEREMTIEGIKVVESKEKFGYYQLTAIIRNSKKHEKFMKDILARYEREHPEFCWYWKWY